MGGFFNSGRPIQIITANALLLLEAQTNPPLAEACAAADLMLPESAGLSWALSFLKRPQAYRMAGIDLAFHLCELAAERGIPVYLIGGEPGVAVQAAQHLRSKISGFRLGGTWDGFFNNDQYRLIINDIKESLSGLVLVALGMPKQDIWIHQNQKDFPAAIMIGIGGSFDVWAGRVKRAPKWAQNAGLEWLYRFWQEPSRWNRMALLPRFFFKVLGQRRSEFGTIRPH